jgi:hypothetical protein
VSGEDSFRACDRCGRGPAVASLAGECQTCPEIICMVCANICAACNPLFCDDCVVQKGDQVYCKTPLPTDRCFIATAAHGTPLAIEID